MPPAVELLIAARPPGEEMIPPSPPGGPGGTAASRWFGAIVDWFLGPLCREVHVDSASVEHLRRAGAEGSVVYVLRYRSLVDTALVTAVLLREGLAAPVFVPDVPVAWLRPLPFWWAHVRRWLLSLVRGGRAARALEDRARCEAAVREGLPIVLFLRRRAANGAGKSAGRVGSRRPRSGTDYLREVVHAGLVSGRPVRLVPVAVMRGRGFRRRESRLQTLLYTVREAPAEWQRLLSLWWNRGATSLTIGLGVELGEFSRRHEGEGEERLVRRLARALQIFLYREEKVVRGPSLRPRARVREIVLRSAELRGVIASEAQRLGQSEDRVRRRAGRLFDEMAANYRGSYFAVLEFAFQRIWPRIFEGLDHAGLDRVVERAREHPVVLVPCHRSHFDYLILTYLFHQNYLSPPHIAAGINLSFWPMGPLFRGAGAFFIRRTFEGDPLYKAVFRNYLAFLIREGYTQEFFIEGGRSRTGKILTPKLGMLSALVQVFLRGERRDLYLVPISIQYGRIVEEESYASELSGRPKEKESLGALLRARSLLRQRRGTVYVRFAEPISLANELGERRERFADAAAGPEAEEEKRRFIQKLGFRILADVNRVAVAGATSVAATALLSSSEGAMRYAEFLRRAQMLIAVLRRAGVGVTDSLRTNEKNFLENLSFLEAGGLVRRPPEDREVIIVAREKRLALDFHKNNTIHFFLLPCLFARGRIRGLQGDDLVVEAQSWLDLYRWEFPIPSREEVATEFAALEIWAASLGALRAEAGGEPDLSHPLWGSLTPVLDDFAEAYRVVARAVESLGEAEVPKKTFLDGLHARAAHSLLLGEIRRTEANSSVTFGNALSRFEEMELVRLGGDARQRSVGRGSRWHETGALVARLAAFLERPLLPERRAGDARIAGNAPAGANQEPR